MFVNKLLKLFALLIALSTPCSVQAEELTTEELESLNSFLLGYGKNASSPFHLETFKSTPGNYIISRVYIAPEMISETVCYLTSIGYINKSNSGWEIDYENYGYRELVKIVENNESCESSDSADDFFYATKIPDSTVILVASQLESLKQQASSFLKDKYSNSNLHQNFEKYKIVSISIGNRFGSTALEYEVSLSAFANIGISYSYFVVTIKIDQGILNVTDVGNMQR